jgi:hypothetical protein
MHRATPWIVVVGIASCILPGPLTACRIPVFRYALEHWKPGTYDAIIVHHGPLSEAQQSLIQVMRNASSHVENPLNLRVSTIDLSDERQPTDDNGPHSISLEEAVAIDVIKDGPVLLLQYPPKFGQQQLAWKGRLTEENVQRLADSPLRHQISRRLIDGQSAVWVLIESGDGVADTQAAAVLRRELQRMESEIKLPGLAELAAEEEFQGDAAELRVEFSIVRMPRDDPREQIFLSLMMESEADLGRFRQPIAIPILGRGRTSHALVGNGINAQNIEETSRFICGDCSCQIKEQNPGRDLLFAVNWNKHVNGSDWDKPELPELTGIGGLEFIDLGIVQSTAAEATPVSVSPPLYDGEDSADTTLSAARVKSNSSTGNQLVSTHHVDVPLKHPWKRGTIIGTTLLGIIVITGLLWSSKRRLAKLDR